FYEMIVLAPRLKAKGMVQLTGRPALELNDGEGVAVYSRSTVADHKAQLSALRFHTFDRDTQLSLLEITTPKKYEYQRIALLFVVRGAEVLYHNWNFERRYSSLQPDAEKPRYPVPQGFVIANHGPKRHLDSTVQFRLIHRFDILSWINSGVARFFVK